ncbi:AraC family transcriptional regulator [Clostridium sp. 'deep sea']|uniref:AraC family transcriptional regulator n=1 Tax=Clostridium sp. 'deep sea' TaxID=2779445 RepID=UPI00189694F6|nr:helix-turn-helix domain-containing protein [Clostridium sp. 'deep sea']QOR34955.1 AraC family transcriptional regulator [Clostridium sp. 'deep sea']
MLSRIKGVIDYVEQNLLNDIDYDEIAKIAYCSRNQFARVFSYITGISLSEYIRRRRLTLAGLDVLASNEKVINIAFKYGYNSPDSFTRAFQNMHGVTPTLARTKGLSLKSYTRISFKISVEGVSNMKYRIVEKESFNLVGVVSTCKSKTINEVLNETTGKQAISWKEAMKEEWQIWDEFLGKDIDKKLAKYKLYRSPMWQMGFTKYNKNCQSVIAIGAEQDENHYDDLQTCKIPAGIWAVFTAKGKLTDNLHPISAVWAKITTEWLPNSNYEQILDYELLVFPPGNTSCDNYECELWMPVRKTKPQ